MSRLLSKIFIAGGLALAAATLYATPAAASDSTAKSGAKAKAKAEPKAKAKAKAKAPSKGKAKAAKPAADDVPDDPEPDITDSKTTEFNCELGNKVTIYTNDTDAAHIALRWKKRLHRLVRVGTTTGANRFENTGYGLTWIGIPSKGMLLDSKLNRQLANECKNFEQEHPVVADAPKEAAAPGADAAKAVENPAVTDQPIQQRAAAVTKAPATPPAAQPAMIVPAVQAPVAPAPGEAPKEPGKPAASETPAVPKS